MVSWSGHIVPFIVTVAIWFIATGLIAWADNRERSTFSRSLVIGGAAGISGLVVILVSSLSAEVWAVYLAFIGALMVWGWHELSFLTGAAAGPRRGLADPGLTGLARFRQAAATVMHHEVALALTALLLISLSWSAPNQIGATVFVLMFAEGRRLGIGAGWLWTYFLLSLFVAVSFAVPVFLAHRQRRIRQTRPAEAAQPAGSGLWLSHLSLSLPTATVVVAMSRLNGLLRPAGAATEIGLVPNTGSAPKVGTIASPREEVVEMPISPSRAPNTPASRIASAFWRPASSASCTPTSARSSCASVQVTSGSGEPSARRPSSMRTSCTRSPSSMAVPSARRS
jgi:hypothetical protein